MDGSHGSFVTSEVLALIPSETGSVLGMELNRGDKCTYSDEEI